MPMIVHSKSIHLDHCAGGYSKRPHVIKKPLRDGPIQFEHADVIVDVEAVVILVQVHLPHGKTLLKY